MLAKTLTCAVAELERVLVEVEISPGLRGLNVVGLPDAAAREAREQVRGAITNSGPDSRFAASPSISRRRPSGKRARPCQWIPESSPAELGAAWPSLIASPHQRTDSEGRLLRVSRSNPAVRLYSLKICSSSVWLITSERRL